MAHRTDAERLGSLREALEYAMDQNSVFAIAGAMTALGPELPWVFSLAKKAVEAGMVADEPGDP